MAGQSVRGYCGCAPVAIRLDRSWSKTEGTWAEIYPGDRSLSLFTDPPPISTQEPPKVTTNESFISWVDAAAAILYPFKACYRSAETCAHLRHDFSAAPDCSVSSSIISGVAMGTCQSCLGRRDRDVYDENEDNRLLYDDGNGIQYGSFGDSVLNGDSETAEAQRETEALQRVVAKTSNNMVDIFEIAPQEPANRGSSTPFAYAGQGARMARYQHLVSKLNANEDSPPAGVKVDWLADEDTVEVNSERPASLKTLDEDDGALVGTFADAAAAMK